VRSYNNGHAYPVRGRLPLDTDLAEMPAAHLQAEGVGQLFQREAAVDDGADPAGFERAARYR
jgi:hypothetical protein